MNVHTLPSRFHSSVYRHLLLANSLHRYVTNVRVDWSTTGIRYVLIGRLLVYDTVKTPTFKLLQELFTLLILQYIIRYACLLYIDIEVECGTPTLVHVIPSTDNFGVASMAIHGKLKCVPNE